MQTPDLRNEAPVSAPGASEVSHPQTTLWENLLWTVPSVSGIGSRFEKQFLLHVLEGLCCMLGSEAAAWATCHLQKTRDRLSRTLFLRFPDLALP